MKLSGRRLEALALLASGASVDTIAQRIGRSPRSIRRWMQAPEWAAAIAEARSESIERCGAMLSSVAPAMLATVVSVAQDASAPASARLAAARDLLDRAGVGVKPGAAQEDDYDSRLAPIMFGNLTPSQKAWIPNEGGGEPDETLN